MSEQSPSQQPAGEDHRVVVIGPDGQATDQGDLGGTVEDQDGRALADLVEQPAKVMRIGSMIRQLLEEVKAAPLDEAGRSRLAQVLHTSIDELKDGLAPELDDELTRLIAPFDSDVPSESELRVAQAQLVGWLEGLFHGIQTAIYAQQMAARAQLEQMRRALPAGQAPPGMAPGMQPGVGQPGEDDEGPGRGGMYL